VTADALVLQSPWHQVPAWTLVTSREEYGGDAPLLSLSAQFGIRDRARGEGRAPSDDTSAYRLVRVGDLVINRLSARDGAYAVSRMEGLVSPAYWVLRPRSPKLDSRWLDYILRSSPYASELKRISKFMPPAQFDLPWDLFRRIPIPLPHLSEQRAIADYLDAETARIDALIEKKQKLLGSLDERRMTVMVDGVSGRFTSDQLVPSTSPWLPHRGASWRDAKLTLVARLGSGHTPSRDHPEWWVDCKVPWITTGEVAQLRSDRVEFLYETRENLSELGIANSSAEIHPKGTVVLCRTASAGYSAIMGTAMATSQDFATWTCGRLIRPRFLLLCLRAMRRDLLGRLAMGSTHKTIYMPDIEALRVPLPEIGEQDAIIDAVWLRLRQTDAVTDGLHRQIELLQEHRQALITAAVTGQLIVPGTAA